jgi:type III secretory pathway component EscS
MKGTPLIAFIAAIVGLVLSLGVAVHEWQYHTSHKYATGLSGVLVVLSLSVALGCLAAALLAWRRGE